MDNKSNKDWEKEYFNSFAKKIPFPGIRIESCKVNPGQPNLIYTGN